MLSDDANQTINYLFLVILYFLPTIIAIARRRPDWVDIMTSNFFFGLTGVWFIRGFIRAFSNKPIEKESRA